VSEALRQALNERLDEQVEEWHHGEGGAMPLHQYLGMTWEQYAFWTENGDIPPEFHLLH
jgi:hypothetical protein